MVPVSLTCPAKLDLLARHRVLASPGGTLLEIAWAQGRASEFLVVFEAPREDQQAWFVRRFGPDVNLANVAPDRALGLETFRLSLRADTYGAPVPGPVSVRGA